MGSLNANNTKEIAERYVERLQIYQELLEVFQSTSEAMIRVENEIMSLEKDLNSKGVKIKEIEENA